MAKPGTGCELCGLEPLGTRQLKVHLEGKRHKRRLRQLAAEAAAQQPAAEEPVPKRSKREAPEPLGQVVGGVRRHLLVLDVNGLLLDRLNSTSVEPGVTPSFVYPSALGRHTRFAVFLRPHLASFLRFALTRFVVGVWSTTPMANLQPLLDRALGEALPAVAFVWGQEHCTAVEASSTGKPGFLKELSKVWAAGHGTPLTTLLLDDSRSKAARNPAHTALHPPAFSRRAPTDDALAQGGAIRTLLEALAGAPEVPAFVLANGGDWK